MLDAFSAPAMTPPATLWTGFSEATEPTEAALTYGASPSAVALLLEVDSYDSGNVTTNRWADRGLIYPDNTDYDARVLNRVQISQSAVDSIGFGSTVALTVSQIDLYNGDRALDDMAALGLAVSRAALVKTMPAPPSSFAASDAGGGNLSVATTIFSGIVGAFGATAGRCSLALSDLSERLNTPLQTNIYGGTGDLDGTPDLKGQPKPISLGYRYNLTPVYLGSVDLGDGALPTFQSHWREIDGHLAVRERGVSMVQVTTAPGIGEWRDWPADGCFQVGFTPDGIITCDVRGDSDAGDYAGTTSDVVKRALQSLGAEFADGDIDGASFARVATRLPGEIGWGIGTQAILQIDAIQEIVSHCGVWLSGNRAGKFRLALAAPQWDTVQISLDAYDIVALMPLPLPASFAPLPSTIEVTAAVNWTPLSDIAGSVSDADRAALAGPGITARATSSAVATRQSPARTQTYPGLYRYEADAQGRAEDLRDWSETGLQMFQVTTDRYRGQVELGHIASLASYPRYGLDSGFTGIVVAWAETPAKGQVAMTLIGQKA